jgi:hypothetical protein
LKNEYEIRGDTVAVLLKKADGNDVECLIDLSDLEFIKEVGTSLTAQYDTRINQNYVRIWLRGKNQEKRLHRFLTDCPDGYVVDHLDGNTLNNRRSNLRVVTQQENRQNCTVRKDTATGVRGVTIDKKRNKFRADVYIDRKRVFSKRFDTLEEAAQAVEKARQEHYSYSRV